MVRTIASRSLLAIGIAIVFFTIFLFVQCVQMTNGNFSEDTLITQTVLYDVLLQESIPNGIDPQTIGGPLFTRVIIYGLFGFVLIGVGGWCQFHRLFGRSRYTSA